MLVVRILHRLGELCPTEVVVEDELPVGDGAVGVALHVAAVKEPTAPLVALDEDPVAVLQRDGLDRRLFAVCLALCRCGCGDGGFIRRVFAVRRLACLVLLPGRLVRLLCRLAIRCCGSGMLCAPMRRSICRIRHARLVHRCIALVFRQLRDKADGSGGSIRIRRGVCRSRRISVRRRLRLPRMIRIRFPCCVSMAVAITDRIHLLVECIVVHRIVLFL